MSKRGKTLGMIAYILFFGSLAITIFGRSSNALIVGFLGLILSLIYIMILRLIATSNKAKLERRAMEDLHRIAEQIDKKES